MRRYIFPTLIVIGVVVWLTPWAFYAVGLANVEGRPVAPHVERLAEEDAALLQREFRAGYRASVERMSPWSYVRAFASDDPIQSFDETGVFAASLIAQDYNYTHLRNRRTLWWHLSGAALAIWLTRNWTSDEVLTAAARYVREHPPRRPARLRQ